MNSNRSLFIYLELCIHPIEFKITRIETFIIFTILQDFNNIYLIINNLEKK
jgi:hypothetical protein